jgi:hypothetical protein
VNTSSLPDDISVAKAKAPFPMHSSRADLMRENDRAPKDNASREEQAVRFFDRIPRFGIASHIDCAINE